MTNEKAVRILQHYQKWRRGEHPYAYGSKAAMEFTPEELGEALDYAIASLESQILNGNQTPVGSYDTVLEREGEANKTIRAQAEENVAKVRGSYDAPGFEACVDAEVERLKADHFADASKKVHERFKTPTALKVSRRLTPTNDL